MKKISIIFCVFLCINVYGSEAEFRQLLNFVRSEFKQQNVNAQIAQMEKIVASENIDIESYGLGRGIFDYWRFETSKVAIKKIVKSCQSSLVNYSSLRITSDLYKSDDYIKYNVKENNLSVLSHQKAQEVFQILKGQEKTLVFSEYGNRCESRAHKMSMLMDELCINSGKVFIESEKIQLEGHSWSWSYHVAPTVLVETENSIETYVMDPAMFDMAVPLDVWVSELRKMHYYNTYYVTLTNKYVLFPSGKNSNPTEYQMPVEESLEYRILKGRLLRFIRYFLGPLKR